ERSALGEQFRTGGAMNRPVDAASAEERRVRGVHDRVDVELRDVAAVQLELRAHFFPSFATMSNSLFVTGWIESREPFFVTTMFSRPRVAFSVSSGTIFGNFETNWMSTIDQFGSSFSGCPSFATSAIPVTPDGSALDA